MNKDLSDSKSESTEAVKSKYEYKETSFDFSKVTEFLKKGAITTPEDVILLDRYEHDLYHEISKLLDVTSMAHYDSIFDSLKTMTDLINQLHILNTQHTWLYFSEIDQTLIPKEWKDQPEEFMKNQFNFFINRCVKFIDVLKLEGQHFLGMLKQLMSRPMGQRLILQLNEHALASGCQIKLFANNPFSAPPEDHKLKKNRIKGEDGEIYEPFKSVQLNFKIKNCVAESLVTGLEETLVFLPLFISLGHELIHVLRCFDGCFINGGLTEPYSESDLPNLFGKQGAMEEFLTITGGGIDENGLRREHNLRLRMGHIFLHSPGGIEFNLAKNYHTIRESIRSVLYFYLLGDTTVHVYDRIYTEPKPYTPITQMINLKTSLFEFGPASIWRNKPEDDKRVPAPTSTNNTCLVM